MGSDAVVGEEGFVDHWSFVATQEDKEREIHHQIHRIHCSFAREEEEVLN